MSGAGIGQDLSPETPSSSPAAATCDINIRYVQICVCMGLGFGCDLCIGLPLDAMQDNIQLCGEKCIYGKKYLHLIFLRY